MSGGESLAAERAPSDGGSSTPKIGEGHTTSPPAAPRRVWPFLIVGIVIVVVVAGVAIYAIHRGSNSSSGGTGMFLEPAGANYTISPGQYNAITFVTKSAGSVNGTIYEASGLVVYLMTPAELQHLAIYGNISGYAWTSGNLGNYSEYNLSIPVTTGDWDVIFLNPNTVVTELTSYLVYVTNIELVS